MKHARFHLWSLLTLALVVRLLSLSVSPLMDTTEARYAEMARLMVDTGNWLTPQFDYGVPFWGKPPLFAWMSAAGIELMGVNELAVRLPHWAAGMLVLMLMAWFAKQLGTSGLITSLVLATCGIFVIASGAVMTDMALTLAMVLAMVGFYQCLQGNRTWGYLVFVGLALGLLAKGPLIMVLVGVAILPWLWLHNGVIGSLKLLLQRLPIVSGSLLMLAIALPWYLMAEVATPGFLNYFFIGEHFKRFLVSGWQGDLYGKAHDEPFGMIWLFWLYSGMPWSLVLPLLIWRRRKQARQLFFENKALSYLAMWMLSPMLLFTLSGNILPAYVLPGIPAIGVIIAILLGGEASQKLWFNLFAGGIPVLLMIALLIAGIDTFDRKSDKYLLNNTKPKVPLYYVDHRPFSGQFYSGGQAKLLQDLEILKAIPQVQLVGKPDQVNPIVTRFRLNCEVVYTAKSQRSLYHCSVSQTYGKD